MGALAWGALGSAVALGSLAVGLALWLRRRGGGTPIPAEGPRVDLVAAEAALLDDDREFDRIIGNLLRSDPTFADSATRLARHDDNGPAV